MPVATFSVERIGFIDANGRLTAPLPATIERPDDLVDLYRAMVLSRAFDKKAVALQRTGRLGTYTPLLGQEAVGIGVAAAMREEDVLLPSFREHGAQFWRGVTMTEVLQYWGGDERGSDFQGPREDFPVCIPVAGHFPHAVGVALAFQLRGEPRVAVAMAGDGATSKGDFYEALNIAGVWRLPTVIVIANNQWAISVPREAQSAAETLAQKAIAAGIPGVQVDGDDVVAVRHATLQAMDRARRGGGATLIEAVTYRLGDHTTVDDARRYRDDAEVSAHWKTEPIARLRAYLAAEDLWRKTDEEALLEDCAVRVQAATDAYLEMPPQLPEHMFDHLYDALPPDLIEQRQACIDQSTGKGNA